MKPRSAKRVYLRRTRWSAVAAIAVVPVLVGLAPPAPASPSPAPGPVMRVHPQLTRAARIRTAGSVEFSCQTPAPGDALCYGPDQIRAAYQIQPLLDRGVDGRGRTIVIIGAYGVPSVAADLHVFDTTWGLPDTDLTVLAPQGVPVFDASDPEQVNWSGEVSLDVQWAHAIAPAAHLVLVEATSPQDEDILAATRYAVDHALGDVISQSFTATESCLSADFLARQHQVFARAQAKGISLVAASGDFGAAQPSCDGTTLIKDVGSPASDPDVIGVGGTDLSADGVSGAYQSETAWNESTTQGVAGGGGYSQVYRRPLYQVASNSSRQRGVPDVSYDSAVDGGVMIYWGLGEGYYIAGGTSAATPQWAGLLAMARQAARRPLKHSSEVLYAASHLRQAPVHDVASGNNTFPYTGADAAPVVVPGFTAGRGWDPVTGIGSPIASRLVPLLALGG